MSDRMALAAWHTSSAARYARMVIEDGIPDSTPDKGSYALLYVPGAQFAAWGITRCPSGVHVWHCGTGTALGTFATVPAALAALPPPAPSPSRRTPSRP